MKPGKSVAPFASMILTSGRSGQAPEEIAEILPFSTRSQPRS